MELGNYRSSDFFIVLSRVNTKLRDDYADLDELLRAEDLDQNDFISYFDEHGYEYSPAARAFKEKQDQ